MNDKEARQNAFASHIITYEEHTIWFDRIMNNLEQAQYILMLGDQPIGQIRLSIEDKEAEIDYSISNSMRGYGYGRKIISLVKEKVKEDYPFIRKLIGKVKSSNIVSYRCFMENDFEENYRQMEYVYK